MVVACCDWTNEASNNHSVWGVLYELFVLNLGFI